MGRLALGPKKRSKQIIAKVTEAEHKRVCRAAKKAGMTVSSYLRSMVGLNS